jgi:hypothetical protein
MEQKTSANFINFVIFGIVGFTRDASKTGVHPAIADPTAHMG